MNHEIIYDKPFKTYEQQIERLISEYGLEIKNINFAKYALSTFSYYDLVNGYKDIFMLNDKFINGTTIEYLTFFYLYDKEFQNLIFRYSLFIENAFKNKMAHIIAKDFGVAQSDYLANCHYNFAYKNKIFLFLKKIITDPDVFKGRKNLFDIYACIIAIYILLDNPFMQANFLGDIAKVYSFKPSEYKSSNEVMSKIRDDYFVITKVQSNINEFLRYSLSSVPLKVPFQ